MKESNSVKVAGLFLVIDRLSEKGLNRWCDELERRGIPAVISIHEETVVRHCDMVKNISDRGFEIACGYKGGPFWGESYDFQLAQAKRIKEQLEACIERPLRILHSKYFAYTEDTLKVADALGIEYIFARGTAGARAVVFQPREYSVKILSVSNVPSKTMGTGSLCDESLHCRTETPDTLRDLLFHLKEDRIILVAQTHVSGEKVHWWKVYQDFFAARIVDWRSLDQFVTEPVVLPNAEIPINTRADYMVPKPLIPLEQEEAM
jgi:hypothetical protein